MSWSVGFVGKAKAVAAKVREAASKYPCAEPEEIVHIDEPDRNPVIRGIVGDDEERSHLISTLQQLVGGTLEQLANSTHVTQLLPYETPSIAYDGTFFCLTGDFACGPRGSCEARITALGGEIRSSVSKKLNYLVVGGLGSPEWKHGSFGTKVEKAMELKREGTPIFLVREEHWLTSLKAAG